MKIKQFPQVIFVTVENDGDEDFLLAVLTKQDALSDYETVRVGVYKFVETQEVTRAQPLSKTVRSRTTEAK